MKQYNRRTLNFTELETAYINLINKTYSTKFSINDIYKIKHNVDTFDGSRYTRDVTIGVVTDDESRVFKLNNDDINKAIGDFIGSPITLLDEVRFNRNILMNVSSADILLWRTD